MICNFKKVFLFSLSQLYNLDLSGNDLGTWSAIIIISKISSYQLEEKIACMQKVCTQQYYIHLTDLCIWDMHLISWHIAYIVLNFELQNNESQILIIFNVTCQWNFSLIVKIKILWYLGFTFNFHLAEFILWDVIGCWYYNKWRCT